MPYIFFNTVAEVSNFYGPTPVILSINDAEERNFIKSESSKLISDFHIENGSLLLLNIAIPDLLELLECKGYSTIEVNKNGRHNIWILHKKHHAKQIEVLDNEDNEIKEDYAREPSSVDNENYSDRSQHTESNISNILDESGIVDQKSDSTSVVEERNSPYISSSNIRCYPKFLMGEEARNEEVKKTKVPFRKRQNDDDIEIFGKFRSGMYLPPIQVHEINTKHFPEKLNGITGTSDDLKKNEPGLINNNTPKDPIKYITKSQIIDQFEESLTRDSQNNSNDECVVLKKSSATTSADPFLSNGFQNFSDKKHNFYKKPDKFPVFVKPEKFLIKSTNQLKCESEINDNLYKSDSYNCLKHALCIPEKSCKNVCLPECQKPIVTEISSEETTVNESELSGNSIKNKSEDEIVIDVKFTSNLNAFDKLIKAKHRAILNNNIKISKLDIGKKNNREREFTNKILTRNDKNCTIPKLSVATGSQQTQNNKFLKNEVVSLTEVKHTDKKLSIGSSPDFKNKLRSQSVNAGKFPRIGNKRVAA